MTVQLETKFDCYDASIGIAVQDFVSKDESYLMFDAPIHKYDEAFYYCSGVHVLVTRISDGRRGCVPQHVISCRFVARADARML